MASSRLGRIQCIIAGCWEDFGSEVSGGLHQRSKMVQVKVDTESTTTSLRVNGLVCVVAIHSGAVCTKTGGVTFPKRYFVYFCDVYIYINVYILYIYKCGELLQPTQKYGISSIGKS